MIQSELELLWSCERQAYGEMVCICFSVNQSQVPNWLLFYSQLRLTKDWYLFWSREAFQEMCVYVCIRVYFCICTFVGVSTSVCTSQSVCSWLCGTPRVRRGYECVGPNVCVGVMGRFGKRRTQWVVAVPEVHCPRCVQGGGVAKEEEGVCREWGLWGREGKGRDSGVTGGRLHGCIFSSPNFLTPLFSLLCFALFSWASERVKQSRRVCSSRLKKRETRANFFPHFFFFFFVTLGFWVSYKQMLLVICS